MMNNSDQMRNLMETLTRLEEAASPEQWEIAVNNLIDEGESRFTNDECWSWVKSELHAMLDFQPDQYDYEGVGDPGDDDDWKMDRTEPELDVERDYNAPPRDDGYGDDY